jgi:SnoaL-like domain
MAGMLSVADRLDIHELLALHGHLMDDGAFDRLDELFTPGFVYDVSLLGGGELRGAAALESAARALGDGNPLGHHVTNVVVLPASEADVAQVRSKGIGVNTDGTTGSVSYEDVVVRTDDGWRIDRRRVVPRRRPLHP